MAMFSASFRFFEAHGTWEHTLKITCWMPENPSNAACPYFPRAEPSMFHFKCQPWGCSHARVGLVLLGLTLFYQSNFFLLQTIWQAALLTPWINDHIRNSLCNGQYFILKAANNLYDMTRYGKHELEDHGVSV
jgi:hypothetical protein